MKPLVIAASLTANAALLVVLSLQPSATSAFIHQFFQTGPASSPMVAEPRPPSTSSPASPAAGQPFAWPEIAPRDFPGLVARLRAAGFPAGLVQAIVTAAVEQHFAARRDALRPPAEPSVYWKKATYDEPGEAFYTALRTLEREHHKLLHDLLGADFYAAEDALHPEFRRRQFGNLPDAKVAALRKIFSDYDELVEQAYAEKPSRVSPEGRAKTALLEKEKRADIERALTPAELLHYDLLNSNAARDLRYRFNNFQPTEAEFLALFPAQKIVADLSAGLTRPYPPEKTHARDEANQQVDAEMRRVLGETRYAEFQRVNDPAYQGAVAFVARQNLPPAITDSLIAIQKDLNDRRDAIDGNRDLTPAQRETQLAAAASETRAKLTAVLGPAGLQAYTARGSPGAWLNEFSSPAPAVAPAAARP